MCLNGNMTKTNSFATKSDVKRLEQRMGSRFGGVEGRLDRVEKRVGKLEDRFVWFRGEIKEDLELWKQDNFRLFEHRWQQFVDPVLKELMTIREEQLPHYAQHQRIDEALTRHDKHFEDMEKLLGKIARKVGVKN